MRLILVIVGIAVSIGVALIVLDQRQGEQQGETPTGRGRSGGPADQVIEHFTLEGFGDEGERIWELEGDIAHVAEGMDIFIEKNVKLTIGSDMIVESDKVFWRSHESRFFTKAPVRITEGLQRIEGVGAQGRVDDDFLQINQNIRMFLDGPVFVTCWGPLKAYRRENKLILYRGATIHDPKGTVKSDRLDVYYDDEAGNIRQIVARDNVRIQRGDHVSYSDVAVYDTETQSVKLVGEPKVRVIEESLSGLESL